MDINKVMEISIKNLFVTANSILDNDKTTETSYDWLNELSYKTATELWYCDCVGMNITISRIAVEGEKFPILLTATNSELESVFNRIGEDIIKEMNETIVHTRGTVGDWLNSYSPSEFAPMTLIEYTTASDIAMLVASKLFVSYLIQKIRRAIWDTIGARLTI